MTDETQLPAPVAPPPLFFGGAFLIGLGLQKLVPLENWQVGWLSIIGVLLALDSLGFAVWGFLTLRAAKTTIHVHGISSALVDGGPYRWSRNPLYVALIVLHVALALIFGLTWPLLVLPPTIVAVQVLVIQREEARLEEWFGQPYLDYKKRVRRWL